MIVLSYNFLDRVYWDIEIFGYLRIATVRSISYDLINFSR
jgi:hypothetical protein